MLPKLCFTSGPCLPQSLLSSSENADSATAPKHRVVVVPWASMSMPAAVPQPSQQPPNLLFTLARSPQHGGGSSRQPLPSSLSDRGLGSRGSPGDEDEEFDAQLEALMSAAWSGMRLEAGAQGAEGEASEEEGEPGGRGRTDDWYLERRIMCCTCRQAVRSRGNRRGQRCAGCRRWFHNTCLPAPASQAAEGAGVGPLAQQPQQPRTLGLLPGTDGLYYHCEGCRAVHEHMSAQVVGSAQAAAVARQQQEGARLAAIGAATDTAALQRGGRGGSPDSDDRSFMLLDLARIRQAQEQEQAAQARQRANAAAGISLQGGSETPLFKKNPKYLRLQQRELQLQPGGAGGQEAGGLARGAGAGASASGSAAGGEEVRRLVVGAPAHREVRAAVSIFGEASQEDELQEVLEDDYALLLRVGGRPVAAASFNLYGADPGTGHARIQALATSRQAQRRGHCRALLGELERVLAAAGVPRLVIMYPDPQAPASVNRVDKEEDRREVMKVESGFRRRLGFEELDLQSLAAYKAVFPDYHRDITRGMAFLVKKIKALP